MDNDAMDNVQDYQSNVITTSQGRVLLIVQSKLNMETDAEITVKASGIKGSCVNVHVESAKTTQ